jgi:glucose/arabinose dehydrogenase
VASDATSDAPTDSQGPDGASADVPVEPDVIDYDDIAAPTPCSSVSACPSGSRCEPISGACISVCEEGSGYKHVLVEWRPEGSDDPNLNFFSPIDLQFAPDGRGFLLQKDGTVWILSGGKLLPEPFVKVPDTSDAWIENGLLGVAIDPQFATSPWIYLFQTYVPEPGAKAVRGTCPPEEGGKLDCPFDTIPNPEEPGTTIVVNKPSGPQPFGNSRQRVIRYWAAEDKALAPDAFEVLLDGLPGGTSTHNGGGLAFGLDGYLFVGLGDSCVDTAARDAGNYPGTILRIDKETGQAAPDNPFVGQGDGKLDRVWAWGIRQGFSIFVHPQTGELYQCENGPTVDEFNWVPKGGNLGWNHGVGVLGNPEFVDPLITWPVAIGPTKSILYTGPMFPELVGTVLMGTWGDEGILRIDLPDPVGAPGAPASFSTFHNPSPYKPVLVAQDPLGHIYYSSALEGKLFRIDRDGGCAPPRALVKASAVSGVAPLEVVLDASASTFSAPAESIRHYVWRLDDGTTETGVKLKRSFVETRPHLVELTVVDDLHQTNAVKITIYPQAQEGNGYPSPHIVFAGPLSGKAPLEVEIVGHGHDPEGVLQRLVWDFGDGSKPQVHESPAVDIDMVLSHTYENPGIYELQLEVVDGVGQRNWSTARIRVEP